MSPLEQDMIRESTHFPNPPGLRGRPHPHARPFYLAPTLYLDNHSSLGCLKRKMNIKLLGVTLAFSSRGQGGYN